VTGAALPYLPTRRPMHNVAMRCANCGRERLDRYCPHCGQNDRDYQRSLPPLLSELLKETFEIDSRLWRTLRTLIFRPGELALEFSRNRRASYVSPIRLYLFVSIAFFFLLSLDTRMEPAETDESVRVELEDVKDADPAQLLGMLDDARRKRASEILSRPDTSMARLMLLEIAQSVSEDTEPPDRAEVYLVGQLVDALYEPGSIVSRFTDNLAAGMLVMLPVYGGLLKLFYFRRHRYYVETLVFSTHLHTFVFLVLMLNMAVPYGGHLGLPDSALTLVSTALVLWLAVYHYLALRRYYGEGRAITLGKFSLLMLIYTVLLLPTAVLIVLAFTVLIAV
jgi:hypothetical protein